MKKLFVFLFIFAPLFYFCSFAEERQDLSSAPTLSAESTLSSDEIKALLSDKKLEGFLVVNNGKLVFEFFSDGKFKNNRNFGTWSVDEKGVLQINVPSWPVPTSFSFVKQESGKILFIKTEKQWPWAVFN